MNSTDNILSLEGVLLKRGDPDYEAARCKNFAENSHYRHGTKSEHGYHPAFIAIAKTAEDVQKCIQYASSNNLKLSVRTGGHNWFGCFLKEDGFLIDMSQFKSMEIDAASRTATVGPAVYGQELNDALSKEGLCFTTGHCVGVPLGGFLLGGGLGWFFPYFGYAAESILEASIVTPEAEIIHVASDSDDWMYLVRGAANGFPGVVTSFKIKLATLPTIVRCKTDMYPVEEYSKIVKVLDKHVNENPGLVKKCELTLSLASTPPPLAEIVKAPKVLMVIFTYFADSEEEFKAATEPLSTLPGVGTPCVAGQFQEYTFKGLSEMLAPAFPPGQQWVARALLYESASMNSIAWEDVQTTFSEKAALGLSHCMLVWCPERLAGVPGCYGKYTSKGFCVLVLGVHGPEEDPSSTNKYVDSMMDVLEPHVWKYDQLEHPLNKETFRKSYLDEADKVMELRSKLDPDNLFFDPSTSEPSH